MKKVLASIGIGSATVDTVFPSRTVTPGESVETTLEIEGGSAEQRVRRIDVALKTGYSTEDSDRDAILGCSRLFDGFTVGPEQRETRTVTLDVPYGTPVTMDQVEVWVETTLVLERAVDATDTDALDVQPTPWMRALFDAAEELGLSFRNAECRVDPRGRYPSSRRFVQAFEFRPQWGSFLARLDAVEFVLAPGPNALDVHVRVGRRGDLPDDTTDERTTWFAIRDADADAIRRRLQSILDEHAGSRGDVGPREDAGTPREF